MYKLGFYVPESHLEAAKLALFAVGAGKIGRYDSCCWQTRGQGQFRPLAGSQPFLGQQGEVESVDEFRVEVICQDAVIEAAVSALVAAHPYEQPAYDVVKLEDF